MVDTETRIRELEHRFRNILTIVRSLVSQSLQAADSIEDARSTIDERLAALGSATEQLLSHNWETAPLPALAENALAHFTLYAERLRLDGPTVTARRTAALSMLGIQTLMPGMCPRHAVLIGTGTQATGHAQALAALYPGLKVTVVGSRPEKAQAFVTALHALHLELDLQPGNTVPHDADVVITLTTSAHPVYSEPARSDRLVVGVGAFKPELAEIAPDTLHASQIYVDDLAGARHEAGDIIQANCSWDSVLPLAHALEHGTDTLKPRVFKTVGCAAWDLAAARCALLAKHT